MKTQENENSSKDMKNEKLTNNPKNSQVTENFKKELNSKEQQDKTKEAANKLAKI